MQMHSRTPETFLLKSSHSNDISSAALGCSPGMHSRCQIGSVFPSYHTHTHTPQPGLQSVKRCGRDARGGAKMSVRCRSGPAFRTWLLGLELCFCRMQTAKALLEARRFFQPIFSILVGVYSSVQMACRLQAGGSVWRYISFISFNGCKMATPVSNLSGQ